MNGLVVIVLTIIDYDHDYHYENCYPNQQLELTEPLVVPWLRAKPLRRAAVSNGEGSQGAIVTCQWWWMVAMVNG